MDFLAAVPDVRPFSHAAPVPRLPCALQSPSPALPFVPVVPAHLPALLADPRTLVLDIRPHAAHADARLPRALSLSVPSTLLKRPLFSLDRLAEMLPSAARHRFAAFHDAARILVYDADSLAIPESSNIYGLLRKFRAAHFAGELSWLRGGFQAVSRELPHLIDNSQDHDDDDTDDASSTGTPILCTRRLPMSAFGPASTVASTPFFDAVRQNRELSHGIIERIPLRLPSRVRRRIADLPLPWLREIAQRADRTHVRTSSRIRHDLDPSSSDSSGSEAVPSTAAVDQGTEILAMQFHRIELAEQKRLMGVMDHHSKESRQPPLTDCLPGRSFPFSITAGVEKGSKNRYQHIWPFEHARVKLCQTGREGIDVGLDDYVNASFVQPLGTTKKYIATQGPLEATFEDFWRLTWQQNVHVIVMLTREVENSMVKCGTYWADAPAPAMRERTFGMLRVTLVAKSGLPGDVDLLHEDGDGDARAKKRRHVTTIKRTFRLEHRGYPNAGSRQVVHLQYLEWPDMTVPEDTRGVLGLVEEVDKAVRETETEEGSPAVEKCQGAGAGAWGDVDPLNGVAWHVVGGRRPVLLHCSAGVGRTGCFIALDAVLDAIRREVTENREGRDGGDMDVDGSSLTSDSGGRESVVHGPAGLVPSTGSQMEDDDGTISGAGNSEQPKPAFDSRANPLQKSPSAAFEISLSSSSSSAFVSGSSSAVFPFIERGATLFCGRHGKECSSCFTADLEVPSQSGRPKSSSFGVGAGPSFLSRSSNSNSHPLPLLSAPLDRQSTVTEYVDVEPRALHQPPQTPVALSTFEEPIWEVVQDMREQRMSLCRSLRQYVFVHRAVVEGALRIVDQEREREKREGVLDGEKSVKATDDIKVATSSPFPDRGTGLFGAGAGGMGMGRSNTFPLRRAQWTSRQPFPPPLSLDMSDIRKYSSSSSGSGLTSDTGSGSGSGSSTMKRGASPTELLKEGKKGELLLSKRPSVKRRMRVRDLEEDGDVQRGAAVALESASPSLRMGQ